MSHGNFTNLLNDGEGIGATGVFDPSEIFSDRNERDSHIEFRLVSPPCRTGNTPALGATLYLRRKDNHVRLSVWDRKDRPHKGPLIEAMPNNFRTQSGDVLDVEAIRQTIGILGNTLYVGPFRNAVNEGAASYYDIMLGTGFVSLWRAWKTGPNKRDNIAVQKVTEDIRRIFGYGSLEINSSSDDKHLQIIVDRKPYRLQELGAGLAQFIVVFMNAAIARPALLLVDEPELNLHPSLQIDFLTSLASYSQQGVLFATHSIGLARALAERIYSFTRTETGSSCHLFEQTPNYAEFVGAMGFSSFKELGFESILLVEGVTDVRTIQAFLRFYGKDHKVVVIPLGGDQLAKGGMEHELKELSRISKRIFALVDSERESESSQPVEARQKFEASCKSLEIDVCVTERRGIENYMTESAIKAEKGDKYRALEKYEKLASCSPAWGKHETWKIAQRMSKDDIAFTDLGKLLERI